MHRRGELYSRKNRIRLDLSNAMLKRVIAYCFLSGLESPQA
ncbi:Hypothetical protein CpCP13_0707 [Corynebacterium pseudotuberculosis]|nr:Hypothetical protein CpPAT10_0692b [Corynebacterium pseudotuberculosis PAT10]AFF21847.1 Hypothetical protein CpP54B96_0704 [Corynebacterium pseudotuberculosis P54B96]AFH51625.1 Hypothetical protein Cp267_0723 [Corynebacterium pseudotuberculosis 267]AJC13429.1 hypothetical protein CpVD57_0708 [Corynebacterium pseudotuberculosis]AKJ55367.1 Hypothetical protein Cp12C_0736 [Corynebacterium pseudotuberculosis]